MRTSTPVRTTSTRSCSPFQERRCGRASALPSRGAAPNARNRNGETPLMLFARKGNGPMVRTLLEKGGDVNLRHWTRPRH
ncbi:MAG: ankyrin repeat domain-containing protein [Betaproteobacteria bacterium]|nr:ankyrin repeat domain-containing protein [Betaproteobacteria bacterium]